MKKRKRSKSKRSGSDEADFVAESKAFDLFDVEPLLLDGNPDRSESIRTETVIGTDERRAVSNSRSRPFRWVCQLIGLSTRDRRSRSRKKAGTGFVIGDRTILTAAHNLWLGDNNVLPENRIDSIAVFPGLDGVRTSPPFGTYSVASGIPHPEYTRSLRKTFDVAVLVLRQPIPPNLIPSGFGKMPWQAVVPRQLHNHKTIVTGYPRIKPRTSGGRGAQANQYFSTASLIVQGGLLFYSADTTGGQSGGPVIVKGKNTSTGQPESTAIGIHIQGGNGFNNNTGVAITRDIGRFIRDVQKKVES